MELYVRFVYTKTVVRILLLILSVVQANNDIDSEIHALDRFIKETIACRNVPGLSISLVRDGHVIMSRGYGHLDIDRDVKATEHTKFCIGSLTKAFTTTLIADILSQQTRVNFDTPLKKILGPCFKLSNDLLTDNVNLRDVLAHKVGTPPYFHALLVGFPKNTSREELIRRLQYMPATEPFRTTFKYSNYMYALAGHVAEVLSNETWEKMVTERLIVPLGMRSTGLIHKIDSLEDIATSYTHKNNRLIPLDTELSLAVSPSDPAGAIYSTASDMAKWMLFHLNNGRNTHGRRLVDDTWLNMTYEAQMTLAFSKRDIYKPVYPISDISVSYNMGWVTSNYRGYRKIWHSGGIVAYQSQLWLFPDKKSGVFVVISGPYTSQGSLAIKAVTSRAADMVLQEAPWLNTTTTCTFPEPWARIVKQAQPSTDYMVFKWNITRTPQDFVGEFGHKGFGNLSVYVENSSSLYLLFGRFGKMRLQPISETVIFGYYVEKLEYFTASDENYNPIRMKFTEDKLTNAVNGVLFPVSFAGPPTWFQKNLDYDWTSDRYEPTTSSSKCPSGINTAKSDSPMVVNTKLVLLYVMFLMLVL